VNDPRLEAAPESANQPPPLVGYNAWSGDRILVEAVKREGGGWIAERAGRMGDLVGSERMQTLAMQANRYAPELKPTIASAIASTRSSTTRPTTT